jgi:hypothetical protein
MPHADLLEAIRANLAASPFTGEGHRKVWARLRILRDLRVSRTRVLRLMRENALLSPHRCPQGKSAQHDGTITTSRPNEMWRTLKEQAIHGRVFRNLEEVRAAVVEFKDRYNRHWRLEKLGFISPHEARQAATLKEAA